MGEENRNERGARGEMGHKIIEPSILLTSERLIRGTGFDDLTFRVDSSSVGAENGRRGECLWGRRLSCWKRWKTPKFVLGKAGLAIFFLEGERVRDTTGGNR